MLFNLLICVFLLLNQSTCSRRFEYLKLIHNSRLLGRIGQTGAYGAPLSLSNFSSRFRFEMFL
uniref:Secreted protein n=1 Tax=Megaselia scalaris TaxID=36166 RepID=T1GDK1_MEGSC